jgi:hypothetical protein
MIHRREMAKAFGQPFALNHGFGGHGSMIGLKGQENKAQG